MTDSRDDVKSAPEWVKDAVFYQIFPDRFAKSEQVRKPSNLRAWEDEPNAGGYYGGDLLGVAEHLDYLEELGINAIYLTPIFQSASNHRYHTHDYKQVDPLLGGNDALRVLIERMHARGMRIILDGVFNHASRGLFQFNDILENGPDSPWLDWFTVDDWPVAAYVGDVPANYRCWVGNRALPEFNTENPEVREFIYEIAEYWINEFDIDGWRLDVPAEITTPGFWEEFRQRVRAAKPDAYLVGEIWNEAPDWLGGKRFDATMNYQLTAAIIAFTAGHRVSEQLVSNRSYHPFPPIDAAELSDRVRRLQATYEWETTLVQYNLVSSHDVARMLSVAQGDKDSLKLATLMLMTYPGVPSIYYGDEIAIQGAEVFDEEHKDEDCRRPFPWHDRDVWDLDMLSFFKNAIALRHRYPVLRHGHYAELHAAGSCYAFARHDGKSTLITAINAGDEAVEAALNVSPVLSSEYRPASLFGEAQFESFVDGILKLKIPARNGVVFGEA